MNAKFKQAVVCLGIITLVSSASVVYSQTSSDIPERAMRHREKRMENLAKELDLTAEQQKQIKEQRIEQREKNRELREKLQAKRTQLREELEKPDIDKSKIYGLIAEINTLMGKQLEQRVESILSMKQILTPEQYEKLQEKRKEGKEERKQHTEQRRGPKDLRRGRGR